MLLRRVVAFALASAGASWLSSGVAHATEPSLPNVGVGYRFAVQGRLNARVDIGVGRESQALYFNFNEAF